MTDRGGAYIDATAGDGGHSTRVLERLSPQGKLFAFDCDPEAIRTSSENLKRFQPRFRLERSRFGELEGELDKTGLAAVDGFLYDLGLRTSALTDPQRGFSYSVEGPLDMRSDPDLSLTAAQVVNSLRQEELAEIFLSYGEERHSRRIAKNIVRRRGRSPLKTTYDLRDAVLEVIPKNLAVKTLSRVFQALRLHINRDLEELRIALEVAVRFLKPGGRMAIVLPQNKFNNANTEYIRKFLFDKGRILAVVGLDTNTFKLPAPAKGTGTKTSILFIQKWKENEELLDDYPIFMATSERTGKNNSGEYIYKKDEHGNYIETEDGQKVIDHDLDVIAEGFIKFAKEQNFDFWG